MVNNILNVLLNSVYYIILLIISRVRPSKYLLVFSLFFCSSSVLPFSPLFFFSPFTFAFPGTLVWPQWWRNSRFVKWIWKFLCLFNNFWKNLTTIPWISGINLQCISQFLNRYLEISWVSGPLSISINN